MLTRTLHLVSVESDEIAQNASQFDDVELVSFSAAAGSGNKKRAKKGTASNGSAEFEDMSVEDLKALLDAAGVDVGDSSDKAELICRLQSSALHTHWRRRQLDPSVTADARGVCEL